MLNMEIKIFQGKKKNHGERSFTNSKTGIKSEHKKNDKEKHD